MGRNPLFSGADANSPDASSPEAALFYNGLFRVSFGRHSSRSFTGTGQDLHTCIADTCVVLTQHSVTAV